MGVHFENDRRVVADTGKMPVPHVPHSLRASCSGAFVFIHEKTWPGAWGERDTGEPPVLHSTTGKMPVPRCVNVADADA